VNLDMLQSVLGGGQKRQEYEEFVNRYDKGEPHEGISEDEAASRYQEVSSQLSDDDYELSAREAFERMSPEQRRQLAQMVRRQGREKNVRLDQFDAADDERDADPAELARMTRHVRKQQPGGLAALLGGGGGGGVAGILSNPVAKSALAGVAAMAAKKVLSR
jgi:hypothetical protein